MKLIEARRKRKLTQEMLENLSGVPQSVISKLETKSVSCDVETDRKLTRALRVKAGTLEYGPVDSEAVAS